MNSAAKLAGLSLIAAAALNGCSAAESDDPVISVVFENYEDYTTWKKERAESETVKPFKPAPIEVYGLGKVKAAPDVAVITGQIETKAKFDYLATDAASKIINAVQSDIAGQDIELSFTQISTREQRDPECFLHNQNARQRHNDIMADNRYNAQLKLNNPTKLKPRPPKPRIEQKTCPVIHITAHVDFTAWVRPAKQAGDILNRFTTAGVTEVSLYGYDFSDYDALYKQASAMAVKNAKAKAEMIAKTARTKLTTLEQFEVDPPQRTSRFGPQAMIISSHGDRFVAAGRYSNMQENVISAGAQEPRIVQESSTYFSGSDEIVVTASKRQPADRFRSERTGGIYADKNFNVNAANLAEALTGYSRSSAPAGADDANNALRMTLLAGPQTVQVGARLSYSYETPLNGAVIIDDEE